MNIKYAVMDNDVMESLVANIQNYSATHVYRFNTDTPEVAEYPCIVEARRVDYDNAEVTAKLCMRPYDFGKLPAWKRTVPLDKLPDLLYKLARQEVAEVWSND